MHFEVYDVFVSSTILHRKSSCEANIRLSKQEITRSLKDSKVYSRVHDSLSLIPTPSQMDPVHKLPTQFL